MIPFFNCRLLNNNSKFRDLSNRFIQESGPITEKGTIPLQELRPLVEYQDSDYCLL